MKKFLIFLIISLFLFSGCKFINEKILKKGADTLKVYTENLEKEIQYLEEQHQTELEKLKQESQARIDSIIAYYENELAGKKGRYGVPSAGTYYLVVGSFITPAYADNYAAKVSEMGYDTEIIKKGKWHFVSAESYSTWTEALAGLEIVRSGVEFTSWIYVSR